MNRFFIEKEQINGERAVITGEDAKHLSTVLRMTRGDCAILCDGANTDYEARIETVEKDRVAFCLLSKKDSESEPHTKVTIFQCLPKAGKLESIIQKCVELGVNEIVPVMAKRSVVRISKKDFGIKTDRYQRVAYEAAKQSGRGIIPKICGLIDLDEINPSEFSMFIMPYEEEHHTTLKKALRTVDLPVKIGIVIGPEGGFDREEARLLGNQGAIKVTLGRRILRTETAGPAVLAMMLYELEAEA